MILIYSHITTPRLEYICSFIFKELMGCNFHITNNIETLYNFDGITINYSLEDITQATLTIQPVGLLFEKDIKIQLIKCFYTPGYTAFFKTEQCDVGFDIFAASFYLISRYEEYLPHKKDIYKRYAHENSIAYKEDFLRLPLINIWVDEFIVAIRKKESLVVQKPIFYFLPTYDIDIAYAYKHKSVIRNLGGALKSLATFNLNNFFERMRVLCNSENDPFNSFEKIDALHQLYSLQPIYFFLVAIKTSAYDKNILPATEVMQQLIKIHSKKYTIGIHPSWQSGNNFNLLQKEKVTLENISMGIIKKSRQHYIRFNLPEGYQRLIEAGIGDDYSMGYGTVNGFRASVASSFFWYDLDNDKQTTLRIHPFCFMESTAFFKQKLNAGEAFDELMHYYNICKQVDGTLITIWHNQTLGNSKIFNGWAKMYQEFLAITTS